MFVLESRLVWFSLLLRMMRSVLQLLQTYIIIFICTTLARREQVVVVVVVIVAH